MDYSEWIILLALGAGGGFLAGLLGVGGGIIFIPVFDYLFRSKGIEGEELVRYILANSFLCIFFSGLMSSIRQYKLQNFFPKQIGLMAVPAMLCTWILSSLITGKDWYNEELFKLLFVLLLLYTLLKSSFRNKKNKVQKEEDNRSWKTVLIGASAGIVSAFSGLGGGLAMIPLMTGYAHYSIRKAASVSIGVIPLLAIPQLLVYGSSEPSSVTNWQWGYIHFGLALPLIAGILLCSGLGVKMAHKIEEKYLKLIFASLILILIVKYILELST